MGIKHKCWEKSGDSILGCVSTIARLRSKCFYPNPTEGYADGRYYLRFYGCMHKREPTDGIILTRTTFADWVLTCVAPLHSRKDCDSTNDPELDSGNVIVRPFSETPKCSEMHLFPDMFRILS